MTQVAPNLSALIGEQVIDLNFLMFDQYYRKQCGIVNIILSHCYIWNTPNSNTFSSMPSCSGIWIFCTLKGSENVGLRNQKFRMSREYKSPLAFCAWRERKLLEKKNGRNKSCGREVLVAFFNIMHDVLGDLLGLFSLVAYRRSSLTDKVREGLPVLIV